MKCPYCENEMDKGKVESNGRMLLFSNRKHHFSLEPGKGEILLDKTMFNDTRIDAFKCGRCKKIIIEYI